MGLYETYKALQEREGSIKLNVNPHTQLITASYIHSGVDFSNTLYRQARGLTFTKDGEIILRGFNKFFNHLELEGYQTYTDDFKEQYARIQESETVLAQEKKDGTMILMGLYKGDLIIGTTSSTDNEFVTQVKNFLSKDWVSERLIQRHLEQQDEPVTLVFEYTAPDNQVVVEYQEEELTLLSQVNNNTGLATNFEDTKRIADRLPGIKSPHIYTLTLEDLLALKQSKKGIEGFVVINSYHNRVKVKTDDWFELSGLYSIFFSSQLTKRVIKTIVGWYINDELDDYLAYQNQHKRYQKEDLIGRVLSPLYEFQEEVQFTIQEIQSRTHLQTRKEMVTWVTNNTRKEVRHHILSQEDISDLRTLKNKQRFYSNYLIDYFNSQNELDAE